MALTKEQEDLINARAAQLSAQQDAEAQINARVEALLSAENEAAVEPPLLDRLISSGKQVTGDLLGAAKESFGAVPSAVVRNPAGAGLRFANAATLNAATPVLSALPGVDISKLRRIETEFDAGVPTGAKLGIDVAGGLAGGAASAGTKLVKGIAGLGLPGQFSSMVGLGGLVGGTSGGLGSIGTEKDTLSEIQKGSGFGALAGAAVPIASRLGGALLDVGRGMFSKEAKAVQSAQVSGEDLAEALRKDDFDEQRITSVLAQFKNDPRLSIADLLNAPGMPPMSNTKNLLAANINKPRDLLAAQSAEVEKAVNDQKKFLPNFLVSQSGKRKMGPREMADDYAATTQEHANKAYEAAFANTPPIVGVKEVEDLLNNRWVQQNVLQEVNKAAWQKSAQMPLQLRWKQIKGPDGNPVEVYENVGPVSTQAFDLIKRQIDRMINRNLAAERTGGSGLDKDVASDLKTKLVSARNAIDAKPEYAPYAVARKTFGDDKEVEEAAEMGWKFASLHPSDVKYLIDNYSEAAKRAFRASQANALAAKIENESLDQAGQTKRYLTSPASQEKMKLMYDDPAEYAEAMRQFNIHNMLAKTNVNVNRQSGREREQGPTGPLAGFTPSATGGSLFGNLRALAQQGVGRTARALSGVDEGKYADTISTLMLNRGAPNIQQTFRQVEQAAGASEKARRDALMREWYMTGGLLGARGQQQR